MILTIFVVVTICIWIGVLIPAMCELISNTSLPVFLKGAKMPRGLRFLGWYAFFPFMAAQRLYWLICDVPRIQKIFDWIGEET